MNCHFCNKVLKGGFGYGEKPYTKFSCADCVIERVEMSSMLNGFQMIVDECNKVVFTNNPKGYKAKFEALSEKIKIINSIAEYFRKKEMGEV